MTIKQGDKVVLHYEGTLENGDVFDTSKHGDHEHPLEFVVGDGKILPAFEENVLGMKKGDKKEFTLKPGEAYGERKEDLQKELPRDTLPSDQEPKVGMFLMMSTPDGQQFPTKIKEVTKDKIVIDLNHPLAGEKLIFNIEVVDVNPKEEKKE